MNVWFIPMGKEAVEAPVKQVEQNEVSAEIVEQVQVQPMQGSDGIQTEEQETQDSSL